MFKYQIINLLQDLGLCKTHKISYICMMIFKNRNTPVGIIFGGDMLIALFSLWISYLLRFDFSIPQKEIITFAEVFSSVFIVRALLFFAFGLHRSILQFTSSQDAIRISLAVFSGSLIFVFSNFILFALRDKYLLPFSIIGIEAVFTVFLMVAARVSLKLIYSRLFSGKGETYQVVIYGAGETGLTAKRAIERDAGNRFRVLCYLEDDPKKIGKNLEGLQIKKAGLLPELLSQFPIKLLIFASQNIPPSRKQDVIDLCLANKTKVLSVPPVSNWINGELSFKQIKKIHVNDLLEREPIQLDFAMIASQLNGKTILVTGAAGSIGSELVRQLLDFRPNRLILIDQAESALYELERELAEQRFPGSLVFWVGDITNEIRMKQIFDLEKPQVVFHAAAYKHVPLMENNPSEALQTNVMGTKVIADLSAATGVEKFVMVSTDKAVKPTNVMGASKRIAEMYVQSLGQISNTCFVTTRFGNVLGSNGSVIPVFKKQIERGGPVTVTHPDVTRYFMTISEASQLVLEASAISEGGEIFIFDMGKSVRIKDLAVKMIRLHGLTEGKDIEIVYTGLRPGEKLYEELLNDKENNLPTHHPQIMRAGINAIPFDEITSGIAELSAHLKSTHPNRDQNLVRTMKILIPDYISNNSVFELLDRES